MHPSAARRPVFALAVVVIATLVSPPAHATWSTDPYVNNLVSQSTTTGLSDRAHCTCTDGSGGLYVAWNSVITSEARAMVQHVLADGSIAPGWPADGLRMTTNSSEQLQVQIAPDGGGGALVAWSDDVNGSRDVYVQRVAFNGTLLAGNGVHVSTSGRDEYPTGITDDGSHGAFVVWTLVTIGGDKDVYAAHVLASGSVDPLWPAVGKPIASAATDETNAVITSDGAGGCFIAWQDRRSTTDYDIYCVRLNGNGSYPSGWSAGGTNETAGLPASDQTNPQIVSDGSGGACLAWNDARNGHSDVYAGRVEAGGSAALGWGPTGIAVVQGAAQLSGSILADGAGGLFVAWDDDRGGGSLPYVRHLRSDGSRTPGWTRNGIPATTSAGYGPRIALDGAGGIFVAWTDGTLEGYDVFAARVAASGALAPNWSMSGTPVCLAPGMQLFPEVVAGAGGGAIVTWWDDRSGSNLSQYAQAVDAFGALGDARPAIQSARDMKADQGGKLVLTWNASALDKGTPSPIGSYWLWRQVPATTAARAVSAGARWRAPGDDATALATRGTRVFTDDPTAPQYAWEFLAAPPANSHPGYSYVASTLVDSTAGHNPCVVFMVEAHAAGNAAFWASAVDSGYSVDNLAPAVPTPFYGSYSAGGTQMTWGANGEPDLAGYRLYRGLGTDWAPGPVNLIATLTSTGYTDPARSPYAYNLTATDVHGNESAPATLIPSGTTDVSGHVPAALELALGGTNPSRGGAMIRLGVPRAGGVRLGIFDAQGRQVRAVADRTFEPGRYTLAWDGRDESGAPVADGL